MAAGCSLTKIIFLANSTRIRGDEAVREVCGCEMGTGLDDAGRVLRHVLWGCVREGQYLREVQQKKGRE
jgi:hypothetical protein